MASRGASADACGRVAALFLELVERAAIEIERSHHTAERFLDRPIDLVGSEIDEFGPEIADERLELPPLVA
jgi:hypothetical protein